MQAITTKYIGPTAHKGARIKAQCGEMVAIIGFPYDIVGCTEESELHRIAVETLVEKYALNVKYGERKYICAEFGKHGIAYVFVPV